MEFVYPILPVDLGRDCFVVWVRWVSNEDPPSPQSPPAQGIRVELILNRNTVLGPTIVYRRDLDTPVYLRANRHRTYEVLAKVEEGAPLDIQLVIHGSIAHAPYAAVYLVRDYEGEAIETRSLGGTPLVQIQPSTPADRWHVAGQANVRVHMRPSGRNLRLRVLS